MQRWLMSLNTSAALALCSNKKVAVSLMSLEDGYEFLVLPHHVALMG